MIKASSLVSRSERLANMFAGRPASELIQNLQTKVQSIKIGGAEYPISYNDGRDKNNCYICSPNSAYLEFARFEVDKLVHSPFIRTLCTSVINSIAPIVRTANLDYQVQFNNWLLATNPAPEISKKFAAELRDILIDQAPHAAIVIRSLNEMVDATSIANLRRAGFELLPARQVYLHSFVDGSPRRTRDQKRDLNLLRKTQFKHVQNKEFGGNDYKDIERLYRKLYIDKYTTLNPQYNAAYIRDMHKAGLLRLFGLRNGEGRLIGASGLFESGKTLTQPIVGYDTAMPQKAGLYRLLMANAYLHAQEQKLILNISAGASLFKRNRGFEPALEYTAVYSRHLPAKRRLATNILKQTLTFIGVPVLKGFDN